MSQQAAVAPPGQPQVMDPEAAYAVVYNRVYAPVFFQKLAENFNIRPNDNAEAMEMLTMAAQLRLAHDTVEKRAAANRPSVLSSARAHLNSQMAALGLAEEGADPFAQQQIKQAAVQGSFDPEIVHALLSMQAAGQTAAA